MDRNFVFIFLFLTICFALSCGRFSGSDNGKLVSPATEVGTPVRDKVTKEIGPEGGVLSADDGRLTLRIPENALSKTISFSIQAITNTAEGGTGNAYRLEPDNSTFNVPLELSMRYKDEDLQDTSLSAMSVAYQADGGEWHELKTHSIDEENRTMTVLTTHFTDWSFLSRLRISPEKAKVRVGESLIMTIAGCDSPGLGERFRRFVGVDSPVCEISGNGHTYRIPGNWFADIGTIDKPRLLRVVYTAPQKKPAPNVATVSLPYELYEAGVIYGPAKRSMLTARITIVDWGFRVSGSLGGDTVISGYICDVETPFTLQTNNPFLSSLSFIPSSANGGQWNVSTKGGITGGSTGQYTIKDAQLVISGFGTGCAPGAGCVSGGGTGLPLTLTRLAAGEECGIK